MENPTSMICRLKQVARGIPIMQIKSYQTATISFWIGSEWVTGYRAYMINERGTIVRVRLVDGACPGLPRDLILKLENRAYPEFWEHEVNVYERLQRLTESYAPECHGTGLIDNTRILILTDVGDMSMENESMHVMDDNSLRGLFAAPLWAMRKCGVIINEWSTRSIQWWNDACCFLDFQTAQIAPYGGEDDETKFFIKSHTASLVAQYRQIHGAEKPYKATYSPEIERAAAELDARFEAANAHEAAYREWMEEQARQQQQLGVPHSL